jgi:surface protein
MFKGCSGLTTLDVSNFANTNVTSMEYMFNGCSGIKTLAAGAFNTSNVMYMKYMFADCSSLQELYLGGWNLSKVQDMYAAFRDCSSLKDLTFNTTNTDFKTAALTNMGETFSGCSSLSVLDLSIFKTDAVTSMYLVFNGCSNLTTVMVSDLWKLNANASVTGAFTGCNELIGNSGKTTGGILDASDNGRLTMGGYKIFYDLQNETGEPYAEIPITVTVPNPGTYTCSDAGTDLLNLQSTGCIFKGWKRLHANRTVWQIPDPNDPTGTTMKDDNENMFIACG